MKAFPTRNLLDGEYWTLWSVGPSLLWAKLLGFWPATCRYFHSVVANALFQRLLYRRPMGRITRLARPSICPYVCHV